MTVHRSLKLKNTLSRSRNVFRRIERLDVLEKDGRRTGDDSVFGLPKVRTRFKVKKKKEGPPAEAGAAPAAAEAKPDAKAAEKKPEAKKK